MRRCVSGKKSSCEMTGTTKDRAAESSRIAPRTERSASRFCGRVFLGGHFLKHRGIVGDSPPARRLVNRHRFRHVPLFRRTISADRRDRFFPRASFFNAQDIILNRREGSRPSRASRVRILRSLRFSDFGSEPGGSRLARQTGAEGLEHRGIADTPPGRFRPSGVPWKSLPAVAASEAPGQRPKAAPLRARVGMEDLDRVQPFGGEGADQRIPFLYQTAARER